jgi:hypothetical protein
VNRILRKVIAMERLAEARGVQLKASVPSTTSRTESRQSACAALFAAYGQRRDILV